MHLHESEGYMIRALKRQIEKFDPYVYARLKKYADIIELNYNALRNKHFIPNPRDQIYSDIYWNMRGL